MPSFPSFLIHDSVKKVALLPLSRNAYVLIVWLLDFERIFTGITAIVVLGRASPRSRLLEHSPPLAMAFRTGVSVLSPVPAPTSTEDFSRTLNV